MPSLRSIYNQRHKLKDHWQISRDLSRFRKECGFLQGVFAKADPKRTVLIVSLTDWIAQVKTEIMWAAAMAEKGLTPIILTNSSNRWAHKYFNAAGIHSLVFFNQMTDTACAHLHSDDIQKAVSAASSFRGLFDYKDAEIDTGRHVLSTIVRTLRSGHVSFTDPTITPLLKNLIVRSLGAGHAARALFSEISPEAVLFLEKGYTPYGEVFDCAVHKGLNVIQYLHSHRDDSYILKRYTKKNLYQHAFSVGPGTWEKVREESWSKEQDLAFMQELKKSYEEGTWFNRKFLLKGKKLKAPEEVRAQLGLDPSKKTAVIFSHVLWDATFFYGKSLFEDYEVWLIETVKAACKNDKVNWVIKLHPDYVWKMKQMGDTSQPRDIVALDANIGKLPAHVHVVAPDTDISTYSFFAITNYCITVRGTIGIETPCFGIPVFTAGTGRYSGLGFTNDSATKEEYLEKMLTIQNFPSLTEEESAKARLHAFTLFNRRPLTIRTFQMIKTSAAATREALNYNVDIRAKSAADIQKAEDFRIFANWVIGSKEEDYLSPL
jgi:hypothetical protein